MIEQIQNLIASNQVETSLKEKSPDKKSVKALQTTLYQLGYGELLDWDTFQDDGIYGGGTKKAVAAFAARIGEVTTGDKVSETVAQEMVKLQPAVGSLLILKRAVDKGEIGTLKRGSSAKKLITALQTLLKLLGGDLSVDGDYGPGTAGAVAAFADKNDFDFPDNGDAVDKGLAMDIMDQFTPKLGPGWTEVKTASAGSGQFFLLHPHGEPGKKRDFAGIEKSLNRLQGETYIFPTPPGTKRHKGKKETRFYSYKFIPGRYELQKEALSFPFYNVQKFNKGGNQILSYFFQKKHTKDQIVIHFTAGQTLGDIKTLTQEDYQVSTAYILGRDGTVYRMFGPEQYAWHLGPTGLGGGYNERSIGIEISNYGYLVEHGDRLIFGHSKEAVAKASEKTLNTYTFCSLEDTEAYVKLDKPYRGYSYFAAYTEEQYEGLVMLLRFLTEKFDINRNFLPTDKAKEAEGSWDEIPRFFKFKSSSDARAFRGICSHVNYRGHNEKWDIGPPPVFKWDELERDVKAATYEPKVLAGRDMFGPELRTEAEMLSETAGLPHGNQDSGIYGPEGPEVDI